MKSRPRIGLTGELAFKTEAKHAVEFAGNGMPAVLSTPNLVGFLERTARETIAGCLEDGERSVGIELDLKHLEPTPIGHTVHCTARVIHTEDRQVMFQLEARDAGELICRGLHKRAVINLEKFSKRVQEKSA
ncbi:MAG TPA: thioesterase family protein [Candidatus Aquilonibacter sp.]|nr:thioesterase family protein [Candidatus Aquilonibacter sp.]